MVGKGAFGIRSADASARAGFVRSGAVTVPVWLEPPVRKEYPRSPILSFFPFSLSVPPAPYDARPHLAFFFGRTMGLSRNRLLGFRMSSSDPCLGLYFPLLGDFDPPSFSFFLPRLS